MYDFIFEKAVDMVLKHEGGYVNDPHDPGGETNYGISKRSYPNLNIRSLTINDATDIYYRDWWVRYGYNQIAHERIAIKILDLAVNMGARQAHKLLQRAVVNANGPKIDIDGVIGEQTLLAINTHPTPELVLAELRLNAIDFYLSLNKSRYLSGWIHRALS